MPPPTSSLSSATRRLFVPLRSRLTLIVKWFLKHQNRTRNGFSLPSSSHTYTPADTHTHPHTHTHIPTLTLTLSLTLSSQSGRCRPRNITAGKQWDHHHHSPSPPASSSPLTTQPLTLAIIPIDQHTPTPNMPLTQPLPRVPKYLDFCTLNHS